MPVGLRERKKLATRRALIEAATRLAAERGPDRITVDDIAGEVGVSARTFFNYFDAKEDAVIGVDPDRAQDLVDALAARPRHEQPLEAVRVALMAHLPRFTEEQEGWALRTALIRRWPHLQARHAAQFGRIERRLVEVVAERIDADPERDLYPTLVVAVAVSALRSALRIWQAPGVGTPLDDLVAEAFTRLAGGLHPPRRRRART